MHVLAPTSHMKPSFFTHLHPPTIPEEQSRLRYTLGAGGLSVFFAIVLFLTGVVEMFYYIPTAEQAALSVQTITYLVPFGGFIRNLHYWAAQALLVSTLVHLLRVVLTGSYAKRRRFNYLMGLILLVLVIFLDFSGYILRWDADIQWVLVTSTHLLKSIPGIGDALFQIVVGGQEYGTATVIRFYAWHIFGLMLAFLFLGVWHLFRVRRDGGIAVPPPDKRESPARITRRQLVQRELTAMLVASILLALLAAFFPAPIAPAMDAVQDQTAAPRAPWFFLWVQDLLRFGEPFLMGVLIPLGLLLILGLIPYFLPEPAPEELGKWWPRKSRAAQIIVIVISLGLIFFSIQAMLFLDQAP